MFRGWIPDLTDRRVLVSDTITILEPGDAGAIVVSASHGGISSAQFAMGRGLAAVVYNDAGVGRNAAGIRGLTELDRIDLPALTVGHDSAEIGNGRDTWANGRVSHANQAALAAGARVGQPVRDAVLALLPTPGAQSTPVEPMLNRSEVLIAGEALLVLDSVSMLRASDRDRVVVTGSHGGAVSGEFALRHHPRLVVFNDAGGGRNHAGIAALAVLDGAGIPSVAIDAMTGEIGQPLDMLADGIVSACNAAAVELGMRPGEGLKSQLAALLADPLRIRTK